MDIIITPQTSWNDVKKAALFTVGKTTVVNSATDGWVRSILRAEHSPIREKIYHIELIGIPYWIANHFRTHFIGANYYMSTSREDRTATQTPRSELSQDAPVNLLISANAQALINISRKRLCGKAHAETRKVWQSVVDEMREVDAVMSEFMVRECVYRGGVCHEDKPCGLFAKRQTIKDYLIGNVVRLGGRDTCERLPDNITPCRNNECGIADECPLYNAKTQTTYHYGTN